MATKLAAVWRQATDTTVERPSLQWRDHLVTTLLTTWALIGLYIDGWAHNSLVGLESFFTPWHGILYAGIAALSGSTLWRVARLQRPGTFDVRAIPVGYGLALVGLALLGVGAVSDATWHELLGFDAGVEAPFSPPHLILLTGGLLVTSAPLRAVWSRTGSFAPTLREILPTLWSLTLTTALVVFFLHYHTVFFRNVTPARPFVDSLARFTEAHDARTSMVEALTRLGPPAFPYRYYTVLAGTACVLITNLILMTPVLLLIRRWRPPFGSVTILFTVVAALTSVLAGFRDVAMLIVALVGGVAGDVLIAALRPSDPDRMAAFRVVAMLIPLALWATYFIVVTLAYGGLGWTPALWSGTTLMACLGGLGLSVIIAPSSAPALVRQP
ncbi:MAG: hypothetical protein HY002_14975 [Candidatus Rokubacteria bacterium]|nr:hypothetical protein [Candidatus Rokubacteria bacterium]